MNEQENKTVNVTFNGHSIKAEFRRDQQAGIKFGRQSWKAFIWGVPEPDDKELIRVAKEQGAPTVHTQRGQYPVLDKAWRKYNKEEVAGERVYLAAALLALGIDESACSISFSRTAGCHCGCSPGFIIKVTDGSHQYPADIFVNVDSK